MQPHRLPLNNNEYDAPTEKEKAAARETLHSLHKTKASCKNCRYFISAPMLPSTCHLKDNKRVAEYNICIHHKKAVRMY